MNSNKTKLLPVKKVKIDNEQDYSLYFDKLNHNQKEFIETYKATNDKYKAYRKAYNKDYLSDLQVQKSVSRLFKSNYIAEIVLYIDRERIRNSFNMSIDSNTIMQEIGKIAFSNMADYYDTNGDPLNISSLPKYKSAAIKQLRIVNDLNTGKIYTEIQLHNKLDALDKLAKHFGFYEADNYQKKDNININNLSSDDLTKLLEMQTKVK